MPGNNPAGTAATTRSRPATCCRNTSTIPSRQRRSEPKESPKPIRHAKRCKAEARGERSRDALVQAAAEGTTESHKPHQRQARQPYRIQQWRAGSFRFSTDPELEAKVVDVVGLSLDPPENAGWCRC
jgi:hypothetical protein